MIRRKLTALPIVLLNVSLALGQQPQKSLSTPQKPASQTQSAPQIDSQDVVKITTNLVQVDAVVTKDEKQVTDLTEDDFELFEDGKPQAITNFSYISNMSAATAAVRTKPPASKANDRMLAPIPSAITSAPDGRRTIALVIDDLGMSFVSIADARKQARKFIAEQIEPNDLVAVIHTSGEVGALQQFTTDRRVLYNAIDRLRWYPCSRVGVQVFTPLGSPALQGDEPCGGTRNTAETLQALRFIVEGMRELPGRKSLVLMSDMLPVETQEPATRNLTPGDGDLSDVGTLSDVRTDYTAQLKKVAELAIRSSVVIYAVDTRGLAYTGMTAADNTHGWLETTTNGQQITKSINTTMSSRSTMLVSGREGGDLIARQTGGFMIRNSNDFGLKRIAEDQTGYYLLAYHPNEATFNRQFHHIKLTVKRKGLTVRTRNGFLGIRDVDASTPLSTGDQLTKALVSPFGANDIPVRLTTIFANFETGSLLRSLLYINPQELTFVAEPDGTQTATFDLGIVLFGDNGRLADQQSRTVTLRLSKDNYQSALQSGVVYTLDTPIKQTGAFQFRVALRDQRSSRIGSAGQFVQAPNLENGHMALSGMVLLKDLPGTSANAPVTLQDGRDAITAGPAVRQFRSGDKLLFAYSIYNAQQKQSTSLPQLTAQTLIFREGKLVFTGAPGPIDRSQSDPKRIASVGRLQLGPEFETGAYVLQVVVTDQLAKDKGRIANQWIDFEIVK